jgi:hypothetical protein
MITNKTLNKAVERFTLGGKRMRYPMAANTCSFLGAVLIMTISLATSALAGEWSFNPYAEFRISYSDNIILADDNDEVEALRLSHRGEGEVDDVIIEALKGLKIKYTASDTWQLLMHYQYGREHYIDEDDENTERHDLYLASVADISENFTWTLGIDGAKQNYRPGAEYIMADYWNAEPFTGFSWKVNEMNTISGRAEYQNRNYESINRTPFHDYDGIELDLDWMRFWNEAKDWRTGLGISWRGRDYDQDQLDQDGAIEDGGDREDDRFEVRAHVLHAWTPRTAGRLGYRYRDNSSNAEFYDYSEHQINGVLIHKFAFWEGLKGTAYTHFRWRDYDSQIAQDVIDPDIPTLESDGRRDDEQWYLSLNADRKFWEKMKVSLNYSYLTNMSNDDSSEYKENRVWTSLRYDW